LDIRTTVALQTNRGSMSDSLTSSGHEVRDAGGPVLRARFTFEFERVQ
jgi:hypothetical protein